MAATRRYFSGIGNDPKNRHFRTVSQGQTYDPDAKFIKMWLPELEHLDAPLAHEPWLARGDPAADNFMAPIVPVCSQVKYRPAA